jgi:hypothetical protein
MFISFTLPFAVYFFFFLCINFYLFLFLFLISGSDLFSSSFFFFLSYSPHFLRMYCIGTRVYLGTLRKSGLATTPCLPDTTTTVQQHSEEGHGSIELFKQRNSTKRTATNKKTKRKGLNYYVKRESKNNAFPIKRKREERRTLIVSLSIRRRLHLFSCKFRSVCSFTFPFSKSEEMISKT